MVATPARADQVVDLYEPGAASYRTALAGVDVVVNAAGVENPALAVVAAERGAAFVDITASSAFGVDSWLATTLLAGLTWVPGASRAPPGPAPAGD